MSVFRDLERPFKQLRVNCLEQVTSVGFRDIITCCQGSLIDFECAMNDNEKVKGDICLSLQRCFHL